jgi:hypothetical protein
MGKAALSGMGKAMLGGMVKAGIGVTDTSIKKPPAVTTSATITSTEGAQRPLLVVAAAIDLGFIAPVVPTTGGTGQDEERGWWRTSGVRLVKKSDGVGPDRAANVERGAGGGERWSGSGRGAAAWGRSRRASAGLLEDRRREASGGGAGRELERAPDSI